MQVVLPERTAPSQMMASYLRRSSGVRHQPSTCRCFSDQRTGAAAWLLIFPAIPPRKPQFFQQVVAAGALSSFLDNTPTYLVFLTTACAQGFTGGVNTTLGVVPVQMLEAISCGAVFMGANTYIGNAPNFMVKSISDENGIRMPSFFGYMLWSLGFLVPVFLLDSLIFFL